MPAATMRNAIPARGATGIMSGGKHRRPEPIDVRDRSIHVDGDECRGDERAATARLQMSPASA